MRRNLRFLSIAAAVIVAVGVLSSCTPEQVAAWRSLGPDPVTAETMTPEQRAVLDAVIATNERRRAIQLDSFLTCVRRHESDRGSYPHTNGYGAQNPSSTASGAYQFLDSTWRNVSGRAGHPGYARASHAPWYVQDAVAHHLAYSGGRSAWAGTNCPGT